MIRTSPHDDPDHHEANQELSFGFPAGGVAVVTGAASGIGRATARLLADQRLVISAWDIDRAGLLDLVADIEEAGGRCHPVVCDVTDAAAVDAAWSESERYGAARRGTS